ncbi:hypothetical protein ACQW02_26195 [Humitalea sp. 24SJ18S-53]|uniref:hypothetical protein n=1 Tax=Humitalea sp. 24SJ18S-53 TaxID=3422307 RepID=UPI003D66E5FC
MSGSRDDEAQPATAADITAILGAIDETMLADIHRTGASAAEVLEAFTRFEGDDAIGRVARRAASARVVEVMAILQSADTGPERD